MEEAIELALDHSAAVLKFKPYVGDSLAPDVTAVGGELLLINAALSELKTDLRYAPRRGAADIDDKKELLLESLEATFKDLNRLFGKLDSPLKTKREAYRSVWKQIDTYFREESNYSLLKRLGYYKKFITELSHILNKYGNGDPFLRSLS